MARKIILHTQSKWCSLTMADLQEILVRNESFDNNIDSAISIYSFFWAGEAAFVKAVCHAHSQEPSGESQYRRARNLPGNRMVAWDSCCDKWVPYEQTWWVRYRFQLYSDALFKLLVHFCCYCSFALVMKHSQMKEFTLINYKVFTNPPSRAFHY